MSESEWTLETLKYMLEQRMDDQDKAVTIALSERDKQVAAALLSNSKRLDEMNEFRQENRENTATYMPRAEAEAAINRLSDRITEVERRINVGEGPRLVASADSERLRTLQSREQFRTGRGQGMDAVWIYLLGVVGLMSTVLSIAYAVTR